MAKEMQEEKKSTVTQTPVKKNVNIIPHAVCLHPCSINGVAVSKNFKWVFTAASDGIIRKFDFFSSMNGKLPLIQAQKSGIPESMSKGGVMESSWENNVPKSEYVETALAKRNPVSLYSIAVQSEAIWALTGQQKGQIKLWSVRVYEGKCHHVMKEHTDIVSCLTISHDEKSFFSGGWDKKIIRWDLNTGQIVRDFSSHTSHITSLSLTKSDNKQTNSPILLSSSIDGMAYCWDLRAPEPIRKFQLEGTSFPWINSACWSADDSKVYCARKNECVEEWDFSSGTLERSFRLPTNSGSVSYVAAFPNGQHVICGSEDNIRVIDLTSQSPKRPNFHILATHSGGVLSSIVIDPESKYLITASGDRGHFGNCDKMCFFYEINETES